MRQALPTFSACMVRALILWRTALSLMLRCSAVSLTDKCFLSIRNITVINGKGFPSMRMLVFKGNLFFLLFVGLAIFGGCGDGDHTDEWVGTWTLEMLDGENYEEFTETALKLGFLRAGGSVEEYDTWAHGFDPITEFTFGDDSRWEFLQTMKPNRASVRSDAVSNMIDAVSNMIFLSTGSYIVTDDEFTMQGDKMNIAFKGRMSGLWKRSGSKLTLFGDDKSGLGTIVLSK